MELWLLLPEHHKSCGVITRWRRMQRISHAQSESQVAPPCAALQASSRVYRLALAILYVSFVSVLFLFLFFWLGFSVFLLNQDTKRGMKGLRQAMTKQFPRQCHQFEPLRVAYLNTLKCPHYATSYVHICFDMHATPQHKATILFILLSPFR